MYDIHQHLLHGVDDGPRSFTQTQDMLRAALANGVSDIIATAHALPGLRPFPCVRYAQSLAEARAWCETNGLALRIYPGAEIFFTDAALRLLRAGEIPTLAGTRYVLIEFSPDETYAALTRAARELGNAGYQAVFAHIERYRCLNELDRVARLREDYDVCMQVNANTILRGASLLNGRWTRRALRRDLIDLVASDAHNVEGRACRMREAYQYLEHAAGRVTAEALCVRNPRKILEDSGEPRGL